MPDEHEEEGPEAFDTPPAFFPIGGPEIDREILDLGEPIEVVVEGVFFAEMPGSASRFVLLSDGKRKLPILIGAFEAYAIGTPLEGAQPDRPSTHDLMKSLLDRLGATVNRVVIDDIWNTTYYAKIYVQDGELELEIDSRPSDAIALALRTASPIFVRDGILNQTGE